MYKQVRWRCHVDATSTGAMYGICIPYPESSILQHDFHDPVSIQQSESFLFSDFSTQRIHATGIFTYMNG